MDFNVGLNGDDANKVDEARRISDRARDLARRVMNTPPHPKTKPRVKPKPDRERASKLGKSEQSGEAS